MAEPIKILIVDDKPNNLFTLKTVLQEAAAEFVEATSGNEALRHLLHHDFALAILDVQMPEMDGYELARLIRGREKTSRLPIIFLSAIYSDSFHIFKGYNSGAVDFITKPFHPEILIGKVLFFMEIYRQQQQLRETISELEHTKQLVLEQNRLLERMATHDELTGLCNRRKLAEVMKREAERSRRYGTELSLLMLDLDHFKKVNDTYGHDFGDFVIKEFAARILAGIRRSDFSFRFGGEEFIVLLPQTGLSGALTAAEKIRALCAEQPFAGLQVSIDMTVSIGVASYQDHKPQQPDDLICCADRALYLAKELGRNRVVVYTSTAEHCDE
ncbi:MAG: GGDEF domain-containing response regulator [Candidatus Electronema sp. V4]|uniref:GGDEF domain-containing response regulator n=1 Tax=Candidatus Electronema sp. V4 TaxID=3454756 RepID=UPI0040554B3A